MNETVIADTTNEYMRDFLHTLYWYFSYTKIIQGIKPEDIVILKAIMSVIEQTDPDGWEEIVRTNMDAINRPDDPEIVKRDIDRINSILNKMVLYCEKPKDVDAEDLN